tara:strand:- start:1120 stop:1887 length:768 start_codon:yes stop_codon:yes gene_type:complete
LSKILLNLFFIYSILITSVAIGQEEKELFVNSIKGAIKIDGQSKENQWEKAKWSNSFWMWRPTDTIQANKQTRFKMLRDEKNIYILIEADINGTNFTTPNLKRDFNTYGADYITLLFDTFNDATNAFSFATNPLGLKADGLISGGNQSYRSDRNYSWDTKWEVETKIEESYYTAEIKIPFSSFFYDNTKTSWRFNIYRRNTQGNENTVWIRTPQNQTIGNLAFMGKMVFEEPLKKARNPTSFIPYLSASFTKRFY